MAQLAFKAKDNWVATKDRKRRSEGRLKSGNPLACRVISALLAGGVRPYIYHESCGGSVYIKFYELELKHTVRVADHVGRKKYSYKFEIGQHLDTCETLEGKENRPIEVFKFNEKDLDLMVKQIVNTKQQLNKFK